MSRYIKNNSISRLFFPLILLLVISSCSSKKTYDPATLQEDIAEFTDDEQSLLVEFFTYYEQNKDREDSLINVPMVMIKSMSYQEILDQIAKAQAEYEAEYNKAEEMMEGMKTKYAKQSTSVYAIGGYYEYWEVGTDFIDQDQFEIWRGRNFQYPHDEGLNSVIVSKLIAQRHNLELGDKIDVNNTEKLLIGIFENHKKFPRDLIIGFEH